MIDEALLIEQLKGYKSKWKLAEPFHEGIANGLQIAIEATQKQPKVGEWIPVSERLPEVEGTMYWTTHEDGSVVQHGWHERHGFIYNWELGEKREKMGTVIAWMPMFKPEPYKE